MGCSMNCYVNKNNVTIIIKVNKLYIAHKCCRVNGVFCLISGIASNDIVCVFVDEVSNNISN